MRFLLITNVVHKVHGGRIYAYGPYVREMNIWEKHINSLVVFAPIRKCKPGRIDLHFNSSDIIMVYCPSFNLLGFFNIFKSIFAVPLVFFKMIVSMKSADHIHIRCPNNYGLLACIAQIFFPRKPKTVKYANNWDWGSKQPLSYRIQQVILRSTFLSKNITVLVYGQWPDFTPNLKSFFTASYSETDKIEVVKPDTNGVINLVFVGTLTNNKRPHLAIEVLANLLKNGFKARLIVCGSGNQSAELETYAKELLCFDFISFLGNVPAENVRSIFIESHFLVFGSKSEGWPKVVAEAMWWGCVPITTAVSCVPEMLDFGSRGVLCIPNADIMAREIIKLVNEPAAYLKMSKKAINWSREYSLEKFENEVIKLLK